ncbi:MULTISPECIES: hypothetical protein [Weeksella]|nr:MULTISPECIES: hypothetical protein [Weeksella]MDK7374285.1 hypothetical protein [Weeksella virosa]MDK7675770.1 hypothetical protein [Weeksella virosa]
MKNLFKIILIIFAIALVCTYMLDLKETYQTKQALQTQAKP